MIRWAILVFCFAHCVFFIVRSHESALLFSLVVCACAAEKREEAIPDDALAVLIVHATALLGASLSQKPELLDAVYKFAGWKQAIVLGMFLFVFLFVVL